MENGELARLRGEIDRVDAELTALLNERFALTDGIGALKRGQGLPVRDEAREAELLARVRERAGENAAEAGEIYRTILRVSRERQEALRRQT